MTEPIEGPSPLVPVGRAMPARPPPGAGAVVARAMTAVCVGVALVCAVLLSGTGRLAGMLLAGFAGVYAFVAWRQLTVPPTPGGWWSRVRSVEGAHDDLVALAQWWKADSEPWVREALDPLRAAAAALAAEARVLDEASWQKRPVDRRLFDLHADQAEAASVTLAREFERVVAHFAATEALPSPPEAPPVALSELADWAVARYQAECALAGAAVGELPAADPVPATDAVRALDALSRLGDDAFYARAVTVIQSAEAAIHDVEAYRDTLAARSAAFPADPGSVASTTFMAAHQRSLDEAHATQQSLASELQRLAAAATAAADLAARNSTLSDAGRRSAQQRMQQTAELLRGAADHGDDVGNRLDPGG